ncbi:hypothetical protein TI04_12440, partial [Achromatium sp. WMS2]
MRTTESNKVLRVAVATPAYGWFDYLASPNMGTEFLVPGMRLRVPFGKTNSFGILWELCPEPNDHARKLKPIIKCLDQQPLLTTSDLDLLTWVANYYHYAIGEVLVAALPTALRRDKSLSSNELNPELSKDWKLVTPSFTMNTDQQQVLSKITDYWGKFQTFLLDGITGSGKTEVYLQAIAQVISNGGQVLVLVPELGLIPQMLQRLQRRFVGLYVALLHSERSPKTRTQDWLAARTGVAQVVLGTRLAVFTPMPKLQLVIV